jgi:rSAM/selenodomain-associated transferase 1
VVVIMAKAPQPGQVKTRLCPPLSPQQAAALYRCFLLDKIAQVDALKGAAAALAYNPPTARGFFQEFAPPHFVLVPQLGADLGACLLSTFIQLFRRGFERVIAVDSDTPTLPSAYLQEALDLMVAPEHDVVLGPTEDGGYYLIGLRYAHRALFEDMPWSTPRLCAETLRRAGARGLRTVCLEPWFDVDTPEDLRRLLASLDSADSQEASHTRRFLRGCRW